MVAIANNRESFVVLWRQLEHTRRLLGMQYRRFSVRNVLKSWFGTEASDEMVWEVCRLATYDDERPVYGLDELPVPSLYPRPSRELLRAVVMVRLGIGMRKVDVKALDEAYTEAFPHSTPLNVNKKQRRRTAGGDKGRTAGGDKGRTAGGDNREPP